MAAKSRGTNPPPSPRPQSQPEIKAGKITNYDQPGSTGDDKLDIMPDVRAFANLIASTGLKPPLSIGLFGDWGAGKSFFMEKLHDEVAANAFAAKQDINAEIKKVKS